MARGYEDNIQELLNDVNICGKMLVHNLNRVPKNM